MVPLQVRGLSRTIAFERADGCLVSRLSRLFGFVPMQGAGAHQDTLLVMRGGEVTVSAVASQISASPMPGRPCTAGPDHHQRAVPRLGWGVSNRVARRPRRHNPTTPALAAHLPRLAKNLSRRASPGTAAGPGLLEGDAGTALALHTAAYNVAPISGWDACLLID